MRREELPSLISKLADVEARMIEEDADDLLGDGVLDIGNNHVDGYPTMRLIHVQEPEVPVNDALDLVQMVHQIGVWFGNEPYRGLELGDPQRQLFDLLVFIFFRQRCNEEPLELK